MLPGLQFSRRTRVTFDGEPQTNIFPRKNAKIKKKGNNAINVDINEGDDDNEGGDNNGDDNVSFTVSAQFPATAVTSSLFTSALPESSTIPPTSIPVLPTSKPVPPVPASTTAKTIITNPPSPPGTTSTPTQTSVPSASAP